MGELGQLLQVLSIVGKLKVGPFALVEAAVQLSERKEVEKEEEVVQSKN